MKRQLVHHLLTVVFVLPVLGIAAYGALDSPRLLNPWNDGADAGLWVVVLPPLICSVAIIANAVLGIFAAYRCRGT